eukprot:gene1937-2203_t
MKSSLCNIEPDGNGFLWCYSYDNFVRRHLGLNRRITFLSTQKVRGMSTLLKTLLLISGNVSPNPGPGKIPCSVCRKPVASNHTAILCDKCSQWCHIGPKCGKVKVKDYMEYSKEVNFEWTCPTCENQTDPLTVEQEMKVNKSSESADGGDIYGELKRNLNVKGLKVAHINVIGLLCKLHEIKFFASRNKIRRSWHHRDTFAQGHQR